MKLRYKLCTFFIVFALLFLPAKKAYAWWLIVDVLMSAAVAMNITQITYAQLGLVTLSYTVK